MNGRIDGHQSSVSDPRACRELTPEEKGILERYRNWFFSDGRKEEKPDLRGINLAETDLRRAMLAEADLSGANFRGANLQDVNLQGACLQGADLSQANLQRANLLKSQLCKANLTGANLEAATLRDASVTCAILLKAILRNADLQNADLTGAIDLLGDQLAGADLSGVKLPESILKFEGLSRVEEAAKNAQTLFLSTLTACVYAWLTIATTQDARLLTNATSSPLPIIGTEIPIAGFYWAAPVLLLSLAIYSNLYLQRLWEQLANTPAIFPDGSSLDRRAYPWLLIGLVRSYFARLRENRPPLSRTQNAAGILLAWWIVPFTLLLFWLRYLSRHDWDGTSLHIGLLAVSGIAAVGFHRLAATTLRGKEARPYLWKKALKDPRSYKRCAMVLGTLGLATLFYYLSCGAIEGVRSDLDDCTWKALTEPDTRGSDPNPKVSGIRLWVPRALWCIGASPFANLVEVDVSTKGANWTTGQKEEEISQVKGARLKGGDLRHANAFRAFLVGADLRGARLQEAYLAEAWLQEADLSYAQLQGANLALARLQGADLRNAQVNGAYFYRASLQGAKLSWAILRGADFRQAQLQGADLSQAWLQGANFMDAQLQGADFRQAQLHGAYFHKARVEGADLNAAIGLTQEQVDSTCVDDKTQLPPNFRRPKPCTSPTK